MALARWASWAAAAAGAAGAAGALAVGEAHAGGVTLQVAPERARPPREAHFAGPDELVVVYDAGTLRWNLESGAPTTVAPVPAGVRRSADGTRQLEASGDALRVLEPSSGRAIVTFPPAVEAASFSPDERFVVTRADSVVAVWHAATGALSHRLPDVPEGTRYRSAGFLPDHGGLLVVADHDGAGAVELWHADRAERRHEIALDARVGRVAWSESTHLRSRSGRCALRQQAGSACEHGHFLAITAGEELAIVDARSGQARLRHPLPAGEGAPTALAVSAQGDGLVVTPEATWLARPEGLARVARRPAEALGFAADGDRSWLVVGGRLTVLDVASGERLATARQAPFAVSGDGSQLFGDGQLRAVGDGGPAPRDLRAEGAHAARFSPDGRWLVTLGDDRQVRLHDVASGARRATLVALDDGAWLAIDPDGRFDTEDAGGLPGVTWARDDGRTLPLTTFAKGYFTPGLLARLWREEPPPPIADVGGLEVAVPEVTLAAEPAGDDVRITAAVCGREGSGARDLRVFVDDRLVGWHDGPLDGPCHDQALTVRVPAGSPTLAVSAHAFNRDDVKSETAQVEVANPRSAVAPARRAFLVHVGVDAYAGKGLTPLTWAGADAHALAERLRWTRGFDVRTVVLAEGGDAPPSRERLQAVLAALAGTGPPPPFAPGLTRSGPDDLVLVTFSGHGYTHEERFHLMLPDVGRTDDDGVLGALPYAVSDEELAAWLRPVVARDLALVVDACQSGAVGEGFKPGPLGSKGFGQLAYDKGMLVLAASQADEPALESATLGHGLLTWALVEDGLRQRRADLDGQPGITLAEWLGYATQRVPELAGEVSRGLALLEDAPPPSVAQTPRLFAFKGGGRVVVAPHGGRTDDDAGPRHAAGHVWQTQRTLYVASERHNRVIGVRLHGGLTALPGRSKGPRLLDVPQVRLLGLYGTRDSGARLGGQRDRGPRRGQRRRSDHPAGGPARPPDVGRGLARVPRPLPPSGPPRARRRARARARRPAGHRLGPRLPRAARRGLQRPCVARLAVPARGARPAHPGAGARGGGPDVAAPLRAHPRPGGAVIGLLTGLSSAALAQSYLVLREEDAAPRGWAEVLVRADRDGLDVRLAQVGEGELAEGPRVCRTPCALALRPASQELWVSGQGRTPGILALRPLPDARYVVVGKMRSKGRNWAGRVLIATGVGLAGAGVLVGLRGDQPGWWQGRVLGASLLGGGALAMGVGIPLAATHASDLRVVRP